MTAPPTSPLADRFAWMIEWFSRMMGSEGHARRLHGPTAVAAWSRYRRLGQRFTALVVAWKAGTLPPVRPARPRPPSTRVAQPRPPGPPPWGRNWLRKLFPDTAGQFAGNLHQVMHTDPELPDLAAATPQAGRMLRPMCWSVGLKPPPYLQLPRRPRPPRARPAPKPKPPETPAQAEARVARMSDQEFANMLHPETENMGWRPPNSIGYAKSRPWLTPLPKKS